jgi:hypothetical protein
VILKAVTLEVLHLVHLVVFTYRLEEFLGKRVAELRYPTVPVPVVEECTSEGMACLRKVLYTRLFGIG